MDWFKKAAASAQQAAEAAQAAAQKQFSRTADPREQSKVSQSHLTIPLANCWGVQWNPPGVPYLACSGLKSPALDGNERDGYYSFEGGAFVRKRPDGSTVEIFSSVKWTAVGEEVLMFCGNGTYGTLIKGKGISANNSSGRWATHSVDDREAERWLRANFDVALEQQFQDCSLDHAWTGQVKCNLCNNRPPTQSGYCVICFEHHDKDLQWECEECSNVFRITFPLDLDDTWACHSCNEQRRWKPHSKEAENCRIRIKLLKTGGFENGYPATPTGGVGDGGKWITAIMEKDVLWLYTEHDITIGHHKKTELPFFQWLNKFLLAECVCDVMEHLLPFICRLNNMLSNKSHPAYTTYRNLSLSEAAMKAFKEGAKIRIPSYLSTSLDGNLEEYKGNTTFVIEIPENLSCCREITSESAFKGEREVLFVPFSAFEVMHVEHKEGPEGRSIQVRLDAKDPSSAGPEYGQLPLSNTRDLNFMSFMSCKQGSAH